MRNAMSTVTTVGEPPTSITGTDSTDIMVTKERTRPTARVCRTWGSTMPSRTRTLPAPRLRAASDHAAVERGHGTRHHQRHERGLLPHVGRDQPSPVEEALRPERLEEPGPDQGVVQEPVL